MLLTPGVLLQAVLFALGVYWCKEMFARWREHFRQIRHPDDGAQRVSLLFLWFLTAAILCFCARFAYVLVFTIADAIRQMG